MLDTRVNTFLAVCRTLNYTHAARALNLTQSAVSQHMAHLERAYGAKLVAIEGKSMRLAERGKAAAARISIVRPRRSVAQAPHRGGFVG